MHTLAPPPCSKRCSTRRRSTRWRWLKPHSARPAMTPGYGKQIARINTMSDENRLNEAAAKALRAQELLDNELLAEAFSTLEQSYIAAWRATTIEDVAGREKLF